MPPGQRQQQTTLVDVATKKGEKEWMVSERSEDIMRATEYVKAYLESYLRASHIRTDSACW